MKLLAVAFIMLLGACERTDAEFAKQPLSSGVQTALLCFKTGEQISGMNKICYYNCGGSAAAITVSSAQLCPLSINR